jgi:hypothetical protein
MAMIRYRKLAESSFARFCCYDIFHNWVTDSSLSNLSFPMVRLAKMMLEGKFRKISSTREMMLPAIPATNKMPDLLDDLHP